MAGRIGSTLQSNPAITCMKFLLTIFNIIFWLSGVAILMLGIWMKLQLYMYMELTTVYFDAAPYVLIGIGSAIILFGSFGCLCTMKGHGRLLYLFVIILLLVFVVELATAVCTYIYRAKVESGFANGLYEAMHSYGEVQVKHIAVDGLQTGLKCCGKDSYKDWYNISWEKPGLVEDMVPKSCCKEKDNPKCDRSGTEDIYSEGCFSKLALFMKSNFTMIGGIAVGFAFLQLLGAMLTCCLARNINKARYEQVD